MRTVIIGAGHGGVEVADALRKGGYEGQISLLERTSHQPYQRPPLSKECLIEAGDPLALRSAAFFAEQHIDLRLSTAVTKVVPDSQQIHLGGGERLEYDDLVFATGAHNRVAVCDGSDLNGVHYLRTRDDLEPLRAAMSSATSVVVVGAGFIGLEFATAARAAGLPTTVIDLADRPMSRVLSKYASDYFSELHQAAGTELIFGEGLASLQGDERSVNAVIGTSGASYPADLVVIGLGVEPASELALQAGLEIDPGIVVNQYLLSSAPHIYALGDCASFPFRHRQIRLEAVQNATDQGSTVAAGILGRDEPYGAVPWFYSDQAGVKLKIAGIYGGSGDQVIRGNREQGAFSIFHFDRLTLSCVESINRPADHMIARKLLRDGTPLSPIEAANRDLDLRARALGN
ncbi:MAG: FAD-dependent oxidoreductase [Antricoccus sp.]